MIFGKHMPLSFFTFLAAMVLISGTAQASELAYSSIADSLCGVVAIFLGPVGRSLATIAIFFVALSVFIGKADKWNAIMIGACICAMFGAIQLVQWTTGFRACQQLTTTPSTTTAPGTSPTPQRPACTEAERGNLRDQECPEGEAGQIQEICMSDGSWVVNNDSCKEILCDDVYKVGRANNFPCTDGKIGMVTKECGADGNWIVVEDHCVDNTATCASGAGTPGLPAGQTYQINASQQVACPSGQVGSIVYTCREVPTGASWHVANNCGVCTPGAQQTDTCELVFSVDSLGFLNVASQYCNQPGYSCQNSTMTYPTAYCAPDGSRWIDVPPPETCREYR